MANIDDLINVDVVQKSDLLPLFYHLKGSDKDYRPMKIWGSDLRIWTYLRTEKWKDGKERYVFREFVPGKMIWGSACPEHRLPKDVADQIGLKQEYMDAVKKTGFLLLGIKQSEKTGKEIKKLFVPHERFFASFCKAFGVGKLLSDPFEPDTSYRDAYLATRVASYDKQTQPLTLMCFHIIGNTYQAVGIFNEFLRTNSYVDVKRLKYLLTNHGTRKTRIAHYTIDGHCYTAVQYITNDGTDSVFQEGVEFSFSDTGDKSYTLTPMIFYTEPADMQQRPVGLPLPDQAVSFRHQKGYTMDGLYEKYTANTKMQKKVLNTLRMLEQYPINYMTSSVDGKIRSMLEQEDFVKFFSQKRFQTLQFEDGCGSLLTVYTEVFRIKRDSQGLKRTTEPKVNDALGKTLAHVVDDVKMA